MKKILIKGPNEFVYEHETKNGLTILMWPTPSNETSISLTIKYGSIHTSFSSNNMKYHVPNGTAHFLEHIKFNEDDHKTAHDYFYSHGSYVNAYTTYNHTSYEVNCNKDILDNLKHLLSFVYNPYFTDSLVEKEKPIIIEESKMVLDNPYNLGYQALANNLYIYNNRKYLITGESKDIKKITKEDAISVYNNYYHPKNSVLVVCGNFDPKDIINTVDEFMLSKSFNDYLNPYWLRKKEPLKVKNELDNINVNVAMSKLMLSFKIPLEEFKDMDKINVLNLINILLDINYGQTSIFNEKLVNEDLKDELYFYSSYEEDDLIINFEVSTKYPQKVRELIIDKYNNMEINEKEFNRKIKSFLANSILGFEEVNSVNNLLRTYLIKYNQIIDDYPKLIKAYKVSDLLVVKNAIKNYVYSSVILNPKDK